MEPNILAVLESKLKEFNDKKNNLLEEIKNLPSEKTKTEKVQNKTPRTLKSQTRTAET